MPAFTRYNSISSRCNLASFLPLRDAQGFFQCEVLCAMGYFLSISSSELLIKSNKNYDLSHRGNIHEKLLMRQVLSPSLSLNFLCSLTPPFVKSVHTQIKFFVPPLLSFASSLPKPSLCLPSSSFDHIFMETHLYVAILDVLHTCLPSVEKLRIRDEL